LKGKKKGLTLREFELAIAFFSSAEKNDSNKSWTTRADTPPENETKEVIPGKEDRK
jgi:hypothetical protein